MPARSTRRRAKTPCELLRDARSDADKSVGRTCDADVMSEHERNNTGSHLEHGGLTGGGGPLEEKGRNSAEVSTERPGPGYAPPALSVDQQSAADSD